jgi:hypothetical protein
MSDPVPVAQGLRPPPRPPTRTAVATDDADERARLLTRFLAALQRVRRLTR